MNQGVRQYGFLDWSGDSGFKFALGSSPYLLLCIVSSSEYTTLRQGLLDLRQHLGLPQSFEFHFAHNSTTIRTAFFATLPHLPWDGAVLLVDKRELPAEFRKMRDPTFYGYFIGDLLARVPSSILEVRRLLMDEERRQSELVRGVRAAMSPVLRARGVKRTPKLRGEPADRWDGLQVADMLARAVVEREADGKNFLRGLRGLHLYRYEAHK